ncbi:MAG: flavodoxin family protein [Candidatus Lokiarchaeota archaeon]|nr:flavodoxin family protein [Candidatus Lokiarchaeota archaeon]MBD3341352.1 flavodoxin family protein [Candidatus Lokiarchaeota archaeon]
MKVVIFNGSPRKDGATKRCSDVVIEELEAAGIECEYVWIGIDNLQGCISCYKCAQNQDKRCSVTNDKLNSYIEKMLEADGIILASPTYFADTATNMKALIERAGMVSKTNGDIYKHKVGAAVVSVRRAGAVHVFSSINFFFLINQMFVVGSSYWNLGVNPNVAKPEKIEKDSEGMATFRNLGKNMALLLKKLNT